MAGILDSLTSRVIKTSLLFSPKEIKLSTSFRPTPCLRYCGNTATLRIYPSSIDKVIPM